MTITKTRLIITLSSLAFLVACSADTSELDTLQAQLDAATDEIEAMSAELESFRNNEDAENQARELVRQFFDPDVDRLDIMHEDYTQFNPTFRRFGEINNVSGREGFSMMMNIFQNMPAPPAPDPDAPVAPANDPTFMVMADGDLGFVIQKQYRPDPMNEGEFYETFWFDAWTIRDGKLYEHWDGATIPDPVPPFLQAPQAQ